MPPMSEPSTGAHHDEQPPSPVAGGITRRVTIGVVLPVYRVAEYVAGCVDSIAAQTIRPDHVVVVDDRGGDDSVERAVARLRRHGLSHEVLRQPENRGLGCARNDGLARLGTDLVWFLDSDDTAEPYFLARLSGALAETGATMATCRTRRVVEDAPGTGYRADRIDEPAYPGASCTGAAFARGLLRHRFTAYAPTKLFRRDALPERLWDEGRAYEDFAPMLRLALAARTVALVNEPLYRYRWRSSSLSARFGGRTTDLFGVGDAVAATLRTHGLDRAWRTTWVGYRYREVLLPVAHLAMRSLREPHHGPGPSPAQALAEVRRRISLRDLPRLIAGRRPRPVAFALLVKLIPGLYRAVLLRR